MFRIWYHDGTRLRVLEGGWDELPDTDVQIVDLLESSGRVLPISGFDYYFFGDFTLGGWCDDPRPWDIPGWIWRVRPGFPADLQRSIPTFPKGTIPEIARGKAIKSGKLIEDTDAAALGLSTAWRPYLEEWLSAHGEL